MESVVVAAFDVGSVNCDHCVLEARVDPETGAPEIIPLALDLYPASKVPSERVQVLKQRFAKEAELFSRVNEFCVETQVPMMFSESRLRTMTPGQAEGMRKASAANAVAYGIAQNIMGMLSTAYPSATVSSVSPKAKFTELGLVRPKNKSSRKTRMRHFMHCWLKQRAQSRDERWTPFVRKYISEEKRDDMADCFVAALGRIVRLVSKQIDLRRVRKKK